MLEVLPMLATQVLVCLPISWVEVLEVLLLEVLCYTQYAIPSFRQVGHPGTCVPAYFGSSADVGCTGTCVPIGWVEVLEVLWMLDAQVLVCLPIGWVELLEVLWMLHAQVLVYLSVGLKCRKFCWDSCADTLCVSAIFPSEMLDALVLVCLSVGSSVGSSADVNAQVLVYLSVGFKCWKFCECWLHRY